VPKLTLLKKRESEHFASIVRLEDVTPCCGEVEKFEVHLKHLPGTYSVRCPWKCGREWEAKITLLVSSDFDSLPEFKITWREM
jgi:hypothetical protein